MFLKAQAMLSWVKQAVGREPLQYSEELVVLPLGRVNHISLLEQAPSDKLLAVEKGKLQQRYHNRGRSKRHTHPFTTHQTHLE
jgi:hypothetical protein